MFKTLFSLLAIAVACPHPEYPRTQLVRESNWMSLNGEWNYTLVDSSQTGLPDTFDGSILVPFPMGSEASGVSDNLRADQALFYNRDFSIPQSWRKGRVILHFGAVDWLSDVYVNGQKVGTHTGGYAPFEFDITKYLRKGSKQSLQVRVLDATQNEFQPRGKQSLVRNGCWYSPMSGIWQSVWVENVPTSHIRSTFATTSLKDSTLCFEINTASCKSRDIVRLSLYPAGIYNNPDELCQKPSHEPLAEVSLPALDTVRTCIKLESPDLWSPDSPKLYRYSVELIRGGKIIDRVLSYTAAREFSVVKDSERRKRIALNGDITFLLGPLDQGYWPEGIYTAPTDEAMALDLIRTKQMGFNMVRKHMKTEPARWYSWCDVLGLVVFQDMPSVEDSRKNRWAVYHYNQGSDYPLSEAARANFYKEWGEIISSLKFFPCIAVWVPFNEAWGQFETVWVCEFTGKADPTRLIDMASGGNWMVGETREGQYCKPGDILDNHHYPDPVIDKWDFEMVNILGEYGGIGLKVKGHLWKDDGAWGYTEIDSPQALLKLYDEYADKLIDLIHWGCAAAIYTQTTDVEIETNGLITYDREVVKPDIDSIRAINERIISTPILPLK